MDPNLGKYASHNPVVRLLIRRFLRRVEREVQALSPEKVVDLGCGEGEMARRLASNPAVTYVGIDRSAEALERARRQNPGVRFLQEDVLTAAIPGGEGTVVLCLEVLEHQAEPGALVGRISSIPLRSAIFSVPWEPWFRLGNLLRGKHWRRLGNHPEHVQRFTPRTLESLLRGRFRRCEVTTCFPWIVAVAANGMSRGAV